MSGHITATSAEPLKLSEKVRAAAALAVSIWLCCSVGDMVARPDDPMAALSLVAHQHVLRTAIFVLLLSAVAAILSALIGPARLPGFACVSVFLGWAVLNWRCGTMEYMLVYESGAEASARSAMFGRLALETLFWGLVAVVALLLEMLARRWLGTHASAGVAAKPAREAGEDRRTAMRRGLLAAVVSAAVGALFISQVAARSQVDEIHRGQIYFAVCGGFFFGALVAVYFSYRVSAWYFVAGVVLTALGSYLWAVARPLPAFRIESYEGLVNVPSMAMARPLPIEYVALGMIGVILGSWSARKVYIPVEGESSDD